MDEKENDILTCSAGRLSLSTVENTLHSIEDTYQLQLGADVRDAAQLIL